MWPALALAGVLAAFTVSPQHCPQAPQHKPFKVKISTTGGAHFQNIVIDFAFTYSKLLKAFQLHSENH